jgi:hypothetical protein
MDALKSTQQGHAERGEKGNPTWWPPKPLPNSHPRGCPSQRPLYWAQQASGWLEEGLAAGLGRGLAGCHPQPPLLPLLGVNHSLRPLCARATRLGVASFESSLAVPLQNPAGAPALLLIQSPTVSCGSRPASTLTYASVLPALLRVPYICPGREAEEM